VLRTEIRRLPNRCNGTVCDVYMIDRIKSFTLLLVPRIAEDRHIVLSDRRYPMGWNLKVNVVWKMHRNERAALIMRAARPPVKSLKCGVRCGNYETTSS